MDLLEPLPGERVLDVGAGQGVLAVHVARRGATYFGVDDSARLIAYARRRHGGLGRFLVADARRLSPAPGIAAETFDAAVFMLCIQDMDPLHEIFASLDWVLRARSRRSVA
jgi:ubiquinone/menaquinone biosynthesis C-methylase UbiE